MVVQSLGFDGTDDDLVDRLPGSGLQFGPSRWSRVGTGLLGGALVGIGLKRRSLGGTALALAGGWLSYRAISSFSMEPADAGPIEGSITIGEPADELADLVRDPESLEQVVGHFADVSVIDGDRYRWTADGPLERDLSWEMRLVEEESGDRLRWEATDDGALFEVLMLSFEPAPGDRGTEVTLEGHVTSSEGAFGSAVVEQLDVVPESLVGVALDRFKSLAETGEIPTTEGNPSARGRGDLV